MELDARVWSFFMFLSISALFIASICTPYDIKGIAITFGECGLWNVDYNSTLSEGGDGSHYRTTQILLVIASAFVALDVVGYLMMFKEIRCISQTIACFAQAMAGLLLVVAGGVFAKYDPKLNEGWWMATMSGIMYFVNAVVILVMPCLDSEQYKFPTMVVHV